MATTEHVNCTCPVCAPWKYTQQRMPYGDSGNYLQWTLKPAHADPDILAAVKRLMAQTDGSLIADIALLSGLTLEEIEAVGGVRLP